MGNFLSLFQEGLPVGKRDEGGAIMAGALGRDWDFIVLSKM